MTQRIIAGRYQIFQEIGRGGCAVVYLAMDLRLKKIWAVKEIRKPAGEAGERLWQRQMAEIRLLKKMNHPAIPRIVDMEESRETLCIVMDYIEGHSLEWIREHRGAQSEMTVRKWGIQICDVLAYLHSRNPPVIYGDLKLSNLISGPDGKIRLVDFGAASEKNAGGCRAEYHMRSVFRQTSFQNGDKHRRHTGSFSHKEGRARNNQSE